MRRADPAWNQRGGTAAHNTAGWDGRPLTVLTEMLLRFAAAAAEAAAAAGPQ